VETWIGDGLRKVGLRKRRRVSARFLIVFVFELNLQIVPYLISMVYQPVFHCNKHETLIWILSDTQRYNRREFVFVGQVVDFDKTSRSYAPLGGVSVSFNVSHD
jgi:hypothetical protein